MLKCFGECGAVRSVTMAVLMLALFISGIGSTTIWTSWAQ
jgi:hypothetical protein